LLGGARLDGRQPTRVPGFGLTAVKAAMSRTGYSARRHDCDSALPSQTCAVTTLHDQAESRRIGEPVEISMQPSQLNYLPLTPPSFSILVGIFIVLLILLQIETLRYAYTRLGVSPGVAVLLLVGSLVGSYFNIPVAQLPEQRVLSGQEIDYYGMRYVVPVVLQWPGTLVAVNVGGAVIPSLMSAYLLIKYRLWIQCAIATACVAAVCYWLARPIPGLGIALPVFVPATATVIVALLVSRQHVAQLAYVAGSLGTLIGADLLNLDKIRSLGAPVASIGGAGTFDGIFLTGLLAVLLASFARSADDRDSTSGVKETPAR
jgi:uncharacterized membrane protein